MRIVKVSLLIFVILINTLFTTGCWNYREVDMMAIVAGLAVDKGINNKYQLTVEIILVSGGKDARMTSKIISAEGETMFDAARHMITIGGKQLYWSHAKVLILSKNIASEGISKVLDWYSRDAETREDVHILISKETTAKEILESQVTTQEIKCMTLEQIIKNETHLSEAPRTDILNFEIQAKTNDLSEVIPTVLIEQVDGNKTAQIDGAAIIKNDKLAGFLNGEETKYLLFVKNEVKGGILTDKVNEKGKQIPVSFEIFQSKTKVKPIIDGANIKMDINVETTVSIGEEMGNADFYNDKGKAKLEQIAENMLKKRIETLIKKIQTEYDADIFDFGLSLKENKPKVWKDVEREWKEKFKDLKVNVNTRVHIKNSAILSKPIKEGD